MNLLKPALTGDCFFFFFFFMKLSLLGKVTNKHIFLYLRKIKNVCGHAFL